MLEIILAFLGPVLIAVITIFGRKWINDNNAILKKDLEEIMEFIGINRNNKSIIKRLTDIKNYYTEQFKDELWREIALERASMLISSLQAILSIYEIELNNLAAIKLSFEASRNRLDARLIDLLGEENAAKFKKERDKEHRAFEDVIENILARTKNHFKEDFAEACSTYLRQILKTMLKRHQ